MRKSEKEENERKRKLASLQIKELQEQKKRIISLNKEEVEKLEEEIQLKKNILKNI